ncbi:MAG: hypothetical protein GF409_01000 [Candidatus Omnitrophica bacterium]|nr:hypothetical protein [Candidatus Omnitrophota bacterium]
MRKYLLIFISIIICVCVSGCTARVKNTGSGGTNIICFGNSITYGQGAEADQAYPFFLGEMVKRNVINSGAPGETSEDALERIDEDVLQADPYIVIIEFGANDYFQRLPEERTIVNLEAMIDRIHDRGAMVALCDISGGSLFGIYNIYHDELKDLAKRKEAIFVPYLMKGIMTDPDLRSDKIHPNAEGYKIIAQRVYRAIEPYL